MVILILEKVPAKLRGELSRWMIEPRTGVFVGIMSALVRDKLWEKVCATCDTEEEKDPRKKGGAVMIARAKTEQGFAVRTHGDPSRELIDAEGVTLVRIPGSRLRQRPGRTVDPGD
jgi:CRISPR-associated protein Cas2